MTSEETKRQLERMYEIGFRIGYKKCQDKMESIIAEFGDPPNGPEAVLAIISEHFNGEKEEIL